MVNPQSFIGSRWSRHFLAVASSTTPKKDRPIFLLVTCVKLPSMNGSVSNQDLFAKAASSISIEGIECSSSTASSLALQFTPAVKFHGEQYRLHEQSIFFLSMRT